MKMVKGLLLGTAAGIVAMSGAQAADLPVKAKAVEYVKVCSVYGSGFYYIPGTDTCIKIGGYVRVDFGVNAAGSHGPYVSGASARRNRDTPGYEMRTRGIFSFDTRTQTEFGTLRSYMRGGWEQNSGDANYRGVQYLDRAFIQFAGLTVGKTQSFFAFYSNALNYSTLQGGGYSDAGVNLIAYTAQFAGGFSASISLEAGNHHQGGIWDASTTALTFGAFPGGGPSLLGPGDYKGRIFPDVVGNLRVDQPWGSAQLSAAVRDTSGGCYGTSCHTGPGAGNNGPNAIGWAVQGGVKFNLPWAQGDEFWVQGTYARGATNYLGLNPFVHTGTQFAMQKGGAPLGAGGNGSAGLAWTMDGIFQTGTNVALVEGWSVLAALQHYWTPGLRTSVFGHYTSLNYGSAGSATSATTLFCTGLSGGAAPGAGVVGTSPLTTCNPSFNIYQVGTRTIWSPVRNLDIGVELLYTRLDQRMVGAWNLGSNGTRPAGLYTARDQDTFSGTLRFQRNFWP